MSEALILAAAGPGEFDGIGDYAWQLARAFSASRPATLVVRRSGATPRLNELREGVRIEYVSSWAELADVPWRAREAAAVFLQYIPQAFFGPDFQALAGWLRARRQASRPVIVTLHEYWPHFGLSPRRMIARRRSRRALRELVAASTAMVASQPYSVSELVASGIVPADRLSVIPVGSMVPYSPTAGAPESGPPTVAIFGQPGMMNWRAVNALAQWLRQAAAPPRFWWFSRSEDELRRWWRRRASEPADVVAFHARLPAAELSRRLQQVTIGLALYVDGASTRRSTLAALLEHRLPVVGLDDRYTDDRLRGSGALALVQPDRVPEVPRAIERLLPDASRRREMSDAAAQLFDRDLAWPRIAAAYQALEAAR